MKKETGGSKIQEICEVIRREALDPAKSEAAKIVEEAHEKAKHILHEAEKESERLFKHAREKMKQERHVFESSLEQAAKQSVEALKQSIEKRLFNEFLDQEIQKAMSKPDVIAQVVQALVQAVEKEGLKTELTAIIPKAASSEEVCYFLGEKVLSVLKDKTVFSGDFIGGALLKVQGKKMTIEMNDHAVKELLADYVRKDFRKLIFAGG